jgi:hypothetical protein
MGAWYSKEKPKPAENTAMVLIGDLGVCPDNMSLSIRGS